MRSIRTLGVDMNVLKTRKRNDFLKIKSGSILKKKKKERLKVVVYIYLFTRLFIYSARHSTTSKKRNLAVHQKSVTPVQVYINAFVLRRYRSPTLNYKRIKGYGRNETLQGELYFVLPAQACIVW